MIIITGAAGFIGSCLINKLNNKGFKDLWLVDDFSNGLKNKNILNKSFLNHLDRKYFCDWALQNAKDIDFIFHIGARTDTTETNEKIFLDLNLNFSKLVWSFCVDFKIPMIYASSAATYGMGENGFDDDESKIPLLKPLNAYAHSKNNFDKFVLSRTKTPPYWAGLKFFNVYGPNEYHKGRMASVIFHAYKSIKETGRVKLFKSHNPEFEDGKQLRDFIYVKDVVDILFFLMLLREKPGIYNVGTGKARSFVDLVLAIFTYLGKEPLIDWVDTPEDIRDKYQYFTQATTDKLKSTGYPCNFFSLEEGINDYVINYLEENSYY